MNDLLRLMNFIDKMLTSVRAPVLLNFLNLFGENDKMLSKALHLIFFPNSFNQ